MSLFTIRLAGESNAGSLAHTRLGISSHSGLQTLTWGWMIYDIDLIWYDMIRSDPIRSYPIPAYPTLRVTVHHIVYHHLTTVSFFRSLWLALPKAKFCYHRSLAVTFSTNNTNTSETVEKSPTIWKEIGIPQLLSNTSICDVQLHFHIKNIDTQVV